MTGIWDVGPDHYLFIITGDEKGFRYRSHRNSIMMSEGLS